MDAAPRRHRALLSNPGSPKILFTDDAWERLDVVAKQRALTAVLNEAHDYASRSAAGRIRPLSVTVIVPSRLIWSE